jgi:NDMA-dependent alcohol dehydrogenase
MRTRAAILAEPNAPFRIEAVELDPPKAGEVLVRMSAVGVCHSDWHLVTGATKHPMPVVPGHEGAGVVESVGADVTTVKVGDHVVLSWAPSCGHCFYCLRDRANLCETYTGPIWNGTMLDGTTRLHWNGRPLYSYCGLAALAEKTVVPAASCVVIDPNVPLQSASLIGCAVATGVGAAMYTANVRPGESVLVFGVGGVGINAIQGARLCGANPIMAVDTTWPKIWVAKHFGASSVFMASDKIEEAVRDITGGRGADHAIDATGVPAVQERAFGCIRPGGTLTLAGLAPMGTATNFPSAVITRQEKIIKGSYYGTVNPPRDFPKFVELYKAGKLNLDDMITKRYPLDQVNEAYTAMINGDVARGVIAF